MADAVPYDDILSKFADNKLDTKEFLDLLFSQDENGVDYLQSLRKEFKEKYVLNAYKKASDYYNKISEKITPKQTDETLDKILDPFDLKKLNKEYKEKLKKIYDDKLKEINANVVVDKQIKNPISDTNVEKVLPESVKNASQEQKTFGEKPTKVTLSEETLQDFNNLLTNNLNLKNLRLAREKETAPVESGGGFLSELLPLLLGGGVAALLISTFWDSHIKPWLEEKFDLKLDFLDRFEGTLEGIAKFFTVSGLQIGGGWLFNLVGKAFTTFGDLLEGSLKAIFNLGFGDDAVKAGVKAAPSVWKTLLPRLAGGLFKGAGLAAFKAIPIIGSLISFYFAYDRFQKDDIIGGIIDIANGLVGFIPYAGVPLSLGLSALNAFLDYKAGDADTIDGKQNIKMDFVNKITEYISNVPIIGGIIASFVGLVEFAAGISSNNTGAVKGGLYKMTKFPLFGVFPSIMLSLLDASTNEKNEFTGFNANNFVDNIKKDTLKTILGWIPPWFGIREKVAKALNITLDGEDIVDPFNLGNIWADAENTQNKAENVKKTFEELKKEQDLENLQNEYDLTKKEIESALQKYNETTVPEMERLNTGIGGLVGESKFATDFFHFGKYLGLGSGSQYYEKSAITAKMKAEMEHIRSLQEKIKILEDKINPTGNSLDKSSNPIKMQSVVFKDDNKTTSTEETPNYFNKFKSFSNAVQRDDYELMGSKEQSILLDNKTKTANILNENDNVLAYKKDGILDQTLKDICNIITLINKNVQKLPENIPVSSPSIVMGGQSGQSGGKSMSYSPFSGTRDSIYEFRLMNKRGVEIV